jgi:starch synthase
VTQLAQSPTKTLRVLFTAAEADPIIKVGGLGDVTGSLPRSLRALAADQAMGCQLDVRLAIPFHAGIDGRFARPKLVARFDVPHPGRAVPAEAYLTHIDDLPVYMIAGAPLAGEDRVYSFDMHKNGQKYTFFSLAVLELARVLNWQPDILHAHDWHTAVAVRMLAMIRERDPFYARTRSVFSVHNLPFMGAGAGDAMADYGIPAVQDDRLPYWGAYQPLPMGLSTADSITTVSPTYAREIMTPEFGCGLQDFLQLRAGSVSGILNGLAENDWDPATDKVLAAPFDRERLDTRQGNKKALLRELSLPSNLNLPLLVFIGRMDHQKGVDLVLDALRQVSDQSWQAILLGTGDPSIEASARQLEAEFPYRMRAVIRFDGRLARCMYAGADILLMPSRYEPCGLAQMIAMRYGCVPLARATGGLRDTIIDNQPPENSTGFLFDSATPQALADALRRALDAYRDQQSWRLRQQCGMRQDFSWQRSAQKYAELYHRLLS